MKASIAYDGCWNGMGYWNGMGVRVGIGIYGYQCEYRIWDFSKQQC